MKGNFLNDKRNGRGKDYHKNSVLRCDTEQLNGEVNGKLKQYSQNDNLFFEGTLINGQESGFGK